MTTRYDGKPLIRLLECYVLWAITELDDSQQATLSTMTPKLQETYGKQGQWHEIIASIMDFPSNMPDLVNDMWHKNKAVSLDKGVQLTPQQFAEVFVDQNFLE